MFKTFIGRCLEGDVRIEAIDDFVEKWHESETSMPLHEYLGFTWDEYKLWAEQPQALRFILSARKNKIPVAQAIEKQCFTGRSKSRADARKLITWLKETGRVAH